MGKHRFVIDGQGFDVEVHALQGKHADVTVNGKRHRVELQDHAKHTPAGSMRVAAAPSPVRQRAAVAAAGELRAPMAGLVLRVPVVGQQVRSGEALLVLDAMKMENTLAAAADGVVQEVAVARGDTVLRGALLVRLALS